MEWLRRKSAPLSEKVWTAIDETAATMFKQTVVARRLADFDGPRGWSHVAAQLGTFKPSAPPSSSGSVRLSVPDVMLLTEVRADFSISWEAIDIFERVGPALDADSIEQAAREMALAEDRLVFYGSQYSPGLLRSSDSPHIKITDWSVPGRIVTDLLHAVQKLDERGIKGPYEVILSPDHYYSYLQQTTEGGIYPAAKQLGIVIAKVHNSPVIEGAVLLTTRGGDFTITVGGDFTIGYRWHDDKAVHLFCVETIAAQLLTPEAICLITP